MLYAQQLTILGHCLAAFHPGGDVIGLHFLDLPVGFLAVLGHAVRADAGAARLGEMPLGVREPGAGPASRWRPGIPRPSPSRSAC